MARRPRRPRSRAKVANISFRTDVLTTSDERASEADPDPAWSVRSNSALSDIPWGLSYLKSVVLSSQNSKPVGRRLQKSTVLNSRRAKKSRQAFSIESVTACVKQITPLRSAWLAAVRSSAGTWPQKCKLASLRTSSRPMRCVTPPRTRGEEPDGFYADVNIGTGGPPSVGTNFSFTSCPILSASRSQSTMLVIIFGPSASSTYAIAKGTSARFITLSE